MTDQSVPQPIQPVTPTPVVEKSKSPLMTIILIILVVFALGVAGFMYWQNQQLTTQMVALTVAQTIKPSPIPTVATVPTTEWKTYTNSQLKYQLNYPGNMTVDESLSPNEIWLDVDGTTPKIEIVIGNNNNGLTSEAKINSKIVSPLKIAGVTTYTDYASDDGGGEYLNYYFYKNNLVYWISFITYPDDKVTIPHDQILSTFKFTENTATPTPTNKAVSYSVPSSWTKSSLEGLTLCLPKNWERNGNALSFNRDANYKVEFTGIREIPYTSGAKREAYYKFWEGEYPNVRELVTGKDVDINGNAALLINPVNAQEPKTSPDGMAVVWYAGGKLWKAGLSSWSMVNNSQSAFLKDFYTAISCSF